MSQFCRACQVSGKSHVRKSENILDRLTARRFELKLWNTFGFEICHYLLSPFVYFFCIRIHKSIESVWLRVKMIVNSFSGVPKVHSDPPLHVRGSICQIDFVNGWFPGFLCVKYESFSQRRIPLLHFLGSRVSALLAHGFVFVADGTFVAANHVVCLLRVRCYEVLFKKSA